MGIGIDAGFEVRPLVRQNTERVGKEEHSDECDDPRDDDRSEPGRTCHIRRQVERATADHGADNDTAKQHQAQLFCRRMLAFIG